MITHHVTTCRLCPAFCGMIAELDGDRIVRTAGDPDHPLSRGYICPKGRSAAAFHYHPKRLGKPLIGGQGASWELALNSIAGKMRSILERQGPDGIGLYTGSGGGWDSTSAPVVQGFFAKLGSRQRYSPVTVDVAPAIRASEMVTGYHWEIRPEWMPGQDVPKVAVVLGSNPVASHGNLGLMLSDPTRLLREYGAAGGELWVIDPRRTETARVAHRHLAPVPNTDAILLAWLVRELLREGADQHELEHYCTPDDVERLREGVEPFTLHVAAARTGIEAEALTELLAAIRRVGKIAMTTGTGLSFSRHGLLAQWLRWVVLIITGSIDNEEGMYASAGWYGASEKRDTWNPIPLDTKPDTPESRPDLPMWFGEPPCVALVDEIESGRIKGMVIHGGSPLTAIPEPDRLLAALKSLELLVVIDVVTNELTEIATHALPAVTMFERSDVTGIGFLSNVGFSDRIVPPAEQRRPTWWMLGQLGKRLGLDVLDGLDPDETSDNELLARSLAGGRHSAEEVFAAGPRGLPIPKHYGWVRERALPDGRWRVAPADLVRRLPELLSEAPAQLPLQLVSGRELHNHNSMAYGRFGLERFKDREGNDLAAVRMNSKDAAERGLADGELVQIKSGTGSVEATLKVDDALRVGAVHIVHGWLRKNATRLSPSDVDPMHGQPVMSGIPVEVVKVSAAA